MSTNLLNLNDHLLSVILSDLPIKDKFKLRVICHRFNRILVKLIAGTNALNLKQSHLADWTSCKFNDLNTLNLTNINQINKLLNKFNRIETLKLKLNCSHLLDYRHLNSPSTVHLRELYLLVNCDSIYKHIIYLQIHKVESLTIYCNQYEHLNVLPKQISFLNYFKKIQYFSTNLKHCHSQSADQRSDQEFNNRTHLMSHTNHSLNSSMNYVNNMNQSLNGSMNHLYNLPPSSQNTSSKYSVQTLQLRNHTINNLYLPHLIIDSFDHLDLIKSFTRIQKLTLLSVKEEYLERFVYLLPYISSLTINHLSTHYVDLEHLFKCFIRLRQLRFLSLTIHQLTFDLQLRLLLSDFLSKSRTRLILNSFLINDLNDLNQFQRFLTILPSRIKQNFNLKHLTGDELDLNYCSNLVLNKFVYNQIRSLTIRKFISANQLRNISIYLRNLHYLEIQEYFGDTDELIFALLGSNRSQLKTMKLIKVNLNDVNTILWLTKWKNIIHLEIQLKFFLNNSNHHLYRNHFDNHLNSSSNYHLKNSNRSIQIKHLIAEDNGENIEKQLINNLYSLVKLEKLQKLILGKFKLTTSLLLYLLQNCPNLYLMNVDHCSNVDHFIIAKAVREKFVLNSIHNR